MKPRLLLEPEARADIADAFAWNEDQRTSLGSEFLAELARVLERIEEHPGYYGGHVRPTGSPSLARAALTPNQRRKLAAPSSYGSLLLFVKSSSLRRSFGASR